MGGNFTEVNEFPWAVFLNLTSSETGNNSRCGGSLISDRFVIVIVNKKSFDLSPLDT